MGPVRIGAITLDCSAPEELAQFWAALLGGEVVYRSDLSVCVRVGELLIAAMRTDDHQAPQWPTAGPPKQLHLDLDVAAEDLDATEAAAVRLGATSAPHQPAPDVRRILVDPAGHPFCLTSQIPR